MSLEFIGMVLANSSFIYMLRLEEFNSQNALLKLPNNIFEQSYPLGEFNLQKEIHSFFYKAAKLSIVGLTAGTDGFGSLYSPGASYLVVGIGGVGTQLKLAFETRIHETIRIELAAMSVNGIVTSRAKTLIFLECFTTKHIDVDLAENDIKENVEAAKMRDFYAKGEYELNGFALDIAKRGAVIYEKIIVAGERKDDSNNHPQASPEDKSCGGPSQALKPDYELPKDLFVHSCGFEQGVTRRISTKDDSTSI
ncbi:hypothetical protein V6N11_077461 [Hibiscus sabdariffa]|uniref:Uncharacterized protein n=1 Tax=Hibiscus sabdariffa TaxID=183260 RepID=A0ABR2TDJ7_9ROSI